MKKILFSVLIVGILFIACNNNKTSESTDKTIQTKAIPELSSAEKIANNYGFKNWKEVTELEFTFNVLRNKMPFSRSMMF